MKMHSTHRYSLVLTIAMNSLWLSWGVAQAATFSVNSTTDAVDANPGDNSCLTIVGECTLRAAIMETNALLGSDTIFIPEGTYLLTIPGIGENASAQGDLGGVLNQSSQNKPFGVL